MRTGLLTLLIVAAGCSDTSGIEPADTVFINGDIHTSNPSEPRASAVAIRDKRFVYVGDDATSFLGKETVVYDLAGGTVIPGIIDAHSHPGWVALSTRVAHLDDISSKKSVLDSIRKMVEAHKTSDAIIGGFWPNELFGVDGPTKEELDAIESDRPVVLYDSWAHSVWANSAALRQANITRDTEDLVPGFAFYQRDENGEPTGWITESAVSLFVNEFQSVTPMVEETLLEYLNYYRSVGVTAVLDAGNFGLDRDIYAAVAKFDEQGVLPVRYYGTYTLFVPDDYGTAVERLKKLRDDFNSDMVRIDTLKIFFDGVLETRTAAVSEDYLDTPGNDGEMLLSMEQVHDIILDLDSEDLNLHVHTVGDRATTTVLDAVEASHETLSRPPRIRITICHLESVKESDLPRFKQLDVIANFTPHWWSGAVSPWTRQALGEKANWLQPARSFIKAGAVVTFSSDITDRGEWKTDRADPFLGMQVGHNREDVGVQPGTDVFGPESERVSREDLLAGYTVRAAYQQGDEDEIGAIAVGLRADMVVLDEDLLAVNRYDIHKIKPTAVIFNGQLVAGDLSAAIGN